jgi:hypothetical protein
MSMWRRIAALGVLLNLFWISKTTAFLASRPAITTIQASSPQSRHVSFSSKTESETPPTPQKRKYPPTHQRKMIPPTPQKKKVSAKYKLENELKWLNWLSRRWTNVPPGKLDAQTIKYMVPAISMYAKRRSLQAADQAEAILQRYIQEYQAGNPQAVLTTTMFNAAMDAYAKIGQPERVQEIMKQMKELAATATAADTEKLAHLRPDVISLTTLATAWTKSRSPHAATKALGILEYMEQQFPDMQPTTVLYNVVLNALVHSSLPDKAQRAEKLVGRMQQRCALPLDTLADNDNNSDHSANTTSTDMDTCCEPSIYTYQSLISCYSRTAQPPEKAEQVLNFLKRQAADHGRVDLEPNAHCFAAAIHAWAYSMEPEKATRAYNLLQDMRKRYEQQGQQSCQPNVVVYTAALNACAKPCLPEERETAFAIAQLIMEELKLKAPKYGTANFLTYAAFLRASATTLPDIPERRDAAVRQCFEQCCQAGQVGQIVLDKLKDAASHSLYRQLLEGVEETTSSLSLPAAWTRNVKGERRE